MDLSASYPFNALPIAVWPLLIDPEVIASCLPGCERLELVGEDRYRAALTVGVASVSGRYTGTVTMLDKRPPHSFRLVVEGSGSSGFVKGEATIELAEQDGMSIVSVRGQAQVGGRIAQVGQRLLGTVSRMMMDQFFSCLQERVTAAPLAEVPPRWPRLDSLGRFLRVFRGAWNRGAS